MLTILMHRSTLWFDMYSYFDLHRTGPKLLHYTSSQAALWHRSQIQSNCLTIYILSALSTHLEKEGLGWASSRVRVSWAANMSRAPDACGHPFYIHCKGKGRGIYRKVEKGGHFPSFASLCCP